MSIENVGKFSILIFTEKILNFFNKKNLKICRFLKMKYLNKNSFPAYELFYVIIKNLNIFYVFFLIHILFEQRNVCLISSIHSKVLLNINFNLFVFYKVHQMTKHLK